MTICCLTAHLKGAESGKCLTDYIFQESPLKQIEPFTPNTSALPVSKAKAPILFLAHLSTNTCTQLITLLTTLMDHCDRPTNYFIFSFNRSNFYKVSKCMSKISGTPNCPPVIQRNIPSCCHQPYLIIYLSFWYVFTKKKKINKNTQYYSELLRMDQLYQIIKF